MLVDANILLYAVHEESPYHTPARAWLTAALSGPRRVGLPWMVLVAFLRIVTNPRAFVRPLTSAEAWDQVREWADRDNVWMPGPTDRHVDVLGDLMRSHQVSANLVSDAHLAALAVEHGLTLYSADTDFARFREIRWVNPVAS